MRIFVVFCVCVFVIFGCSSVMKSSEKESFFMENLALKKAEAKCLWEYPKDVDNPEWKPTIISPNGIVVIFKYEYGLPNADTIKCIGLWESGSEYLCTYKDEPGRRTAKNKITNVFYFRL